MKCIYFATDNHALIKLRKLICMPLTAINHFAVSHHDRSQQSLWSPQGVAVLLGKVNRSSLGVMLKRLPMRLFSEDSTLLAWEWDTSLSYFLKPEEKSLFLGVRRLWLVSCRMVFRFGEDYAKRKTTCFSFCVTTCHCHKVGSGSWEPLVKYSAQGYGRRRPP